ncbi:MULTISPECIES: M23 family metallopeptidase [Sorangium]|uniref:Exported peptidase n=1 Tax=Sorangium cellulosum TaxID=56 RepID=A0A4P2QYZ5_SORCE|nr:MULTISPECIES: M23 family metallopeptidase [Sorangium]AUX35809.1 exported peptidase [Sorangium cellulosum]WCQ95104.1 endolysin [Sorangium sp. Soce836]
MKPSRKSSCLAPVLALAAALAGCGSDPEGPDLVWPIGGTDEIQPMSSSFGPRLQASRDGVYDFHRGIDIPTPMGTPVYAVADGKVTRAGRYDDFEDVVVQIAHCDAPGACFYSTYIHLAMPLVETGDRVGRGEHIGYTGLAASSLFPHLHFEIRDGGTAKVNCVHPLRFLPAPAGLPPALAVRRTDKDSTSSVTAEVEVTLPGIAPGLIEVAAATERRSTGEVIEERVFNYDEWNRQYTAEGDAAIIDEQSLGGIRIEPAKFNAQSSAYVVAFRFSNLDGTASADDLRITARARDVNGHVVEASAP